MTPPEEEAGDAFSIGDRIRLEREIDNYSPGVEGTVIGFIRLDPELVVIALDSGSVVKVDPNDIERRS